MILSRLLAFVVVALVVSSHASVAISQIALGLSLATALALRMRPSRVGIEFFVFAFFAWAVLMVPFSEEPARSFEGLKRFYLFTAIWLMAGVATTEARRRGLAIVFVAGAVVVSVVGTALWVHGGGELFVRRAPYVSNPMTTGAMVMIAALVALSFALGRLPSKRERLAAWLCVGVLVTALAATMTRSAILGFAAGLLVVVIRVAPGRQLLAFAALAVVFGGLVFVGRDLLPSTFTARWNLEDLAEGRNTSLRLEMWEAGIRMFLERPWLGWGDVSLGDLSLPYYDAEPEFLHGHLHSNLVQIAVIWGLPGLALYLAFVARQVIALWRRRADDARPWAQAWRTAALAVTVAFFVAGLTEWYFGDAEPLLLAMIVYGVGAAPDDPPASEVEA